MSDMIRFNITMKKNNSNNNQSQTKQEKKAFDTDAATLPVQSIDVSTEELRKNLTLDCRKKQYDSIVLLIQTLIEDVVKILDNEKGFVRMNNGTLYCNNINALTEPPEVLTKKQQRYTSWPKKIENLKVGNLNADLISEKNFTKLIAANNNPYKLDEEKFIVRSSNSTHDFLSAEVIFKILLSGNKCQSLTTLKNPDIRCVYKYRGSLSYDTPSFTASFFPVVHFGKTEKSLAPAQILTFWCLVDIMPENTQKKSDYQILGEFLRKHHKFISMETEDIINKETFFNSFPISPQEIAAGIERMSTSSNAPQAKEILAALKDELLKCDEYRANIRPVYEEKLLTSPNRGHWDLWEQNRPQNTVANVPLSAVCCDFYARNPKHDIKVSGVIGIDFGTRSTTVVRKIDKEKDKPMRIGFSNFEEMPTSGKDYENPTVMQFVDFQSFFKAYRSFKGRPHTRWADLTVSHTAADRLKETTDSESFPSFLSELKQWAGGKHSLRLRDLKGNECVLPPFGDLPKDDFDPLELYAYYIGLNINHMRNGIFLRYEISYPVTYDKDILDRIRLSFERGIRKSLPVSILKDKEVMKNFYVRYGASEPAAYSLCALKEYGFEPTGDEKHFYGVFDFGGGTTDFDFGIFREATDDELDEGVDYVLEHFRPSGDKYLGGENLLQLIAFEVFKENKVELLQKKINFPKPFETDKSSFEGEEGLISDSQEARLNMHQMMEQLRPIWEGTNNPEEDKFASGTLKLTLFDKNGNQQTGISLTCDAEKLKECIRIRIKKGIVNFFARLHETFKEPYVPEKLKKINIFLAGNSCKSPIVTEIFKEQISIFEKDNNLTDDFFELYPPLGSPEAKEKQKRNTESCDNSIEIPTGKTGVAFGLVMGRAGSNYRIIDQNMDEHGIAFRFYVGKSRKGVFQPVLNMTSERGKWTEFRKTGSSPVLEVLYSALSEAGTGQMPDEKCNSIPISIVSDDMNKILYIRVKNANEFEYAIASSEEAIDLERVKCFNLEM